MSAASERRDTPLARALIREIEALGPIGVDVYMRRCLTDPAHGYYTTRSGIGSRGDFTTAPEISQVFGELIGLWAAVVWQQMGAPARLNLVELGPGRGVLIADALRAARILPDFGAAIDLHLCEINPAFRALQAERLRPFGIEPHWHDVWPSLDASPTIVIANEFLDAIPGGQWQQDRTGAWHEVCVGIADGALAFVTQPGSPPFPRDILPATDSGAIYTHTDIRPLVGDLGAQARRAPLAALFIDYGHAETAWGDTLQAVRDHKPEHPLTSPGEADLSLAVDFAALRRAAVAAGLATDGPAPQAEFLGALGITERASRLMAANPARANDIESAVFRLMSSSGMGTRFLALALRSTGLAPLPGFASAEP